MQNQVKKMSLKQINKITQLGVVAGRHIALVKLNDDSKRLYYRSSGTNRGVLQTGRWCRFNGINLYDVDYRGHDCIGNFIKPSSDALESSDCQWYIDFLQNQHPEIRDLEYAFEDTQDVFVTSVLDEELRPSFNDKYIVSAYKAYLAMLSELYKQNEDVKKARRKYKNNESKINVEDNTQMSHNKNFCSFDRIARRVKQAASFMEHVKGFGAVELDPKSTYLSYERIDEAAWAMTIEKNFEDLSSISESDSDKSLSRGLKKQAADYREDYYNRKCEESVNAFRENPEPLVRLHELEKKHALISRCVGKSGPGLISELRKYEQEQLNEKLYRLLSEIKNDNEWGHEKRTQFIRAAKTWLLCFQAKHPAVESLKRNDEHKYATILNDHRNALEEQAKRYANQDRIKFFYSWF